MSDNDADAGTGRRPYSKAYQLLTPAIEDEIVKLVAEGYSLSGASSRLHVHPVTLWTHRKANPDLDRRIREAIEIGTDLFEDAMREKALAPNGFLANIATLKARRPGKWRDDRPQAQTPTINIVINAPSAQQLRDALDGEYRIIADAQEREALPEPDDAMLYDADSST